MVTRFVPLMLVCGLAACAGPQPLGGEPTIQVVQSTELPPPDGSDLTNAARPYLIGPFDKLIIDVFGIEELSEKKVQADASGRISFPLVGSIEAANKTPAQLANDIEGQLRGRFVKNPQVTVNLEQTLSQTVTIDGQVREPGLYPVIGHMTLMRAVATAKGLDEFAKKDDVVIFRKVKGQQMVALYNLQAIRRGAYSDPEVFASDIVVVGESKSARMFASILQAAPLAIAPIVALIQNRR